VDRWPVFEPDYQKYIPKDADYPSQDIDRYQPEMAQRQPLEIPPPNQPIAVSIEEVILLTLANNRDLQVEQLNPIIAGTFEQIERGVYDPELFTQYEYAEETSSETSRATGEQFAVDATNVAVSAGLRQELPSGTSLEVTVDQERDQSNRAPDQRTARLGLSITQSLLRGFGPAVNLVSIRQAKLDRLASIYQLRGFTESLVAETEIAYWNYVLAREEISIYESSLAIAGKQRDEIEQQIEIGLLPETEAAAARAEVARREQALIDARSLLRERQLRLLKLINIGHRKQLDRQIKATSKPIIQPEPIDNQADRLDLAEITRPDLNQARLNMKQGVLETIVSKNGLMPKLDLFINLGRTGFAESFSESFQELDGTTYDFRAGARLSHYLGNRSAKARQEAAWSSHQQALEAVENLRQVIQLEVRLAINELERARQQIIASRATRRLEEQTVWAEQERFQVGSSTALLVAQAQRDLLVSQIAEIKAIINYRIALVTLYLAEGSLLERRGISIGEQKSSWSYK
jgi:outer membrane protein TolC